MQNFVKNMGVLCQVNEFSYSMKDGNFSFERQTVSPKQGSVTSVLWSVMFCCDVNIQSEEGADIYNNSVYIAEVC